MAVRKRPRAGWFEEVPTYHAELETRKAVAATLDFVRLDLGLDDLWLRWFDYRYVGRGPPDTLADDPALAQLSEEARARFEGSPLAMKKLGTRGSWGVSCPRPVIWLWPKISPSDAIFWIALEARQFWQQREWGPLPTPPDLADKQKRSTDKFRYAENLVSYLKRKDQDVGDLPRTPTDSPNQKIRTGFTSHLTEEET